MRSIGGAKSSYYYWQAHRQPTAARLHLQVQVKAIHAQVNHVYGSRRMSTALKAQGLNVGRYQARSLMQEAHVIAIQPKKKHTYRVWCRVWQIITLTASLKPANPIKNG